MYKKILFCLAGLTGLAFFLSLAIGSPASTSGAGNQVLPVIVIDPGHGGKDAGVIGADGVKEKDVCLELAIKIQDECRRRGDLRVILTRDTDEKLSALERVSLANREKANAFISIHFNASFSPFASGQRIYYCRGDDSAQGNGGFRRWQGVAAAHWPESRRLASLLTESLGAGEDSLLEINSPILQGVDMPAVLVEVAFLSTELELEIIREKEEAILLSILGALESFFEQEGNGSEL